MNFPWFLPMLPRGHHLAWCPDDHPLLYFLLQLGKGLRVSVSGRAPAWKLRALKTRAKSKPSAPRFQSFPGKLAVTRPPPPRPK